MISGLQYWTERADQTDKNNTVFGAGTGCIMFFIVPFPTPMGACAATPGFPNGFSSIDVSPYMAEVAAARVPSFTRRLVDHQSAYLEFEWSILERLMLIGEARYVDEDNAVVAAPTGGNQGPGSAILCGATGPCGLTSRIPYAGQPGPTQFLLVTYKRSESYVTPRQPCNGGRWITSTCTHRIRKAASRAALRR